MQPYRTFVNALGVSNAILLRPETPYNFATIRVPLKTYAYWYWNLKKLTIAYRYRIDDEDIKHLLELEPRATSDLLDRIRGFNPWNFETSDDKAKTKTRVNFNLGMPFDASVPIAQRNQIGQNNDAAFKKAQQQSIELSKKLPRLCTDKLLPLETPIGINFCFGEDGYSMDNPNVVEFEIRTVPTPNVRTNWHTISTMNAVLMEQKFPVELRSLYSPNEIKGELIEFTITPEFHTFEKTEQA